ncbi:hypothetical protein FEM48_Zijuj06G0179100 [Ziziphus jujuba var. spinosa]|uniref:Lon N-terminal domain-containing protein n=1 Tax=Ziziphus jujuba var. spinosa TaxID=714518 RepID=A0A978VAR8_ZIZJJ|nr:hypothetical protein FEM48_Zijuj06G0179100 [Ziziphus jujuba var. spinosa]
MNIYPQPLQLPCCTAFNLRNPTSSISSSGTRLLTRNPYPHSLLLSPFPHLSSPNANTKRRRVVSLAATSLELPLLPFVVNEVLVPSESKTLHLYEARYLSLLEESLMRKKKLFVHFVLDPILVNDSSTEPSFAARYGCLVCIENVERLDVGALVSIRGVGRVKLVAFLQAKHNCLELYLSGLHYVCAFVQAEPYLQGIVVPEHDKVPDSPSRLSSKVIEVKEALSNLNSLEIKLKAPKEALLQTSTANSLVWAEKEPFIDCDEAFIPSLPERVSFVGLQPVSGSTQSELQKLQNKKLRAMELKDTLQRLDDSLELIKENISMVAAKLAIQSLETK